MMTTTTTTTTAITKRLGLALGLVALLLLSSTANAQSNGVSKLPVPIVNVNVAAGTVTAGSETYHVTGSTRLLDPKGLQMTLNDLKVYAMDKLNVPVPDPSDLKWALVKSQSGTGLHDDLVELALKPEEGG